MTKHVRHWLLGWYNLWQQNKSQPREFNMFLPMALATIGFILLLPFMLMYKVCHLKTKD